MNKLIAIALTLLAVLIFMAEIPELNGLGLVLSFASAVTWVDILKK